MMKSQIGLGVLSIPSAFDTLGMVPGVICLLAVAVITTWSASVIGKFKLRHRDVYGIDDAGGLMFGAIGRNMLGFTVCLCSFPATLLEYGTLTSLYRLVLRRWLWNAQYLNQSECLVDSRYMHGYLPRYLRDCRAFNG